MRYVEGFDFKSGSLSARDIAALEANIAGWDDHASSIYMYKHEKKTYMASHERGDLSIFGIGDVDTGDTKGIVWGSNERAMMEFLYGSSNKALHNFFPYKVIPKLVYAIHNGECFQTEFSIGSKVETPLGKGTIYSIDDVISIELENDTSLLHEFDISELSLVKEDKQ